MYEILMKRAYETNQRSLSKGIDDSIYQQLYNILNGYSLTEKNYDRQLEKVKKFLLRAIDRFLKFKLTFEEEMGMVHSRKVISYTMDEETIYECVLDLLDATQRFK